VFPLEPALLDPLGPDGVAELDDPHLASSLDSRALSLCSRACTRAMRLAMASASFVCPADLALVSRASA